MSAPTTPAPHAPSPLAAAVLSHVGLSRAEEDVLQELSVEVNRDYAVLPEIPGSEYVAKILKNTAAKLAAKGVARIGTGWLANVVGNLLGKTPADKLFWREMIENPSTGFLFGNIDALAAMPVEEI